MLRLNQYDFYHLSTVLHPLIGLQGKKKAFDVFFALFSAKSPLEAVLQNRLIPLVVSKPSAQKLLEAIDGLLATVKPVGTDLDEEIELEFGKTYPLQKALEAFETVLSAELQSLDTYFVSQKLAYATHDLIENAEKVLPETTQKNVPKQVIDDIRQSGRCLAFELPTASGFHIMRATEKVLREYYTSLMGKPPGRKDWKECVDELKTNGKADPKILLVLDQIRELHRNPLMHPEDFLNMNEALALFDIGKTAIILMAEDMPKV